MKPTRSLENNLKMCVSSLEIKEKIFLNAYDLQELNLQDVNNINKFITLKEMEAVHKEPFTMKSPELDEFTDEQQQIFKGNLIPINIYQHFTKQKGEGIASISSY